MTAKATYLKKAHIAHMIRSAAAITGRTSFVMVGTGAVIAQLKNPPLTLMQTREIDIHADGGDDAASVSDLIDGTIGEGSQFDETFGYYAHGIEEGTAILPRDWRTRAIRLPLQDQPSVTCICPEVNDIALSKLCAWREKDQVWLRAAYSAGLLNFAQMRSRVPLLDGLDAGTLQAVQHRIGEVAPQRKHPAGTPGPAPPAPANPRLICEERDGDGMG